MLIKIAEFFNKKLGFQHINTLYYYNYLIHTFYFSSGKIIFKGAILK